ncbi:MAG: sugar transferase [Fuerstiella sp.]|nr:sugar transferase [Fuerstiella sp.]MCP4786503.1 sugar transferase [Fuerstiella sp.]MCP4857985.1 sugar transferase [Fuerstiella sp.]
MNLDRYEKPVVDSIPMAPTASNVTVQNPTDQEEIAGRITLGFRRANSGDNSRQTHLPLLRPWSQFVKRSIDILIALPVVLFVLPVMCLVVKIAQRLQSSGPMFYRQDRCGRHDRQFSILKFRTMHVPLPDTSDIECDSEARSFPLGRFLRNSKIDEIPQFVNVLLGSMSVVGPRPHHLEDCKRFEGVVEDYRLRSIARPGITGLAQYREYRGAFAWNCTRSRVERDLKYINTWSQWLDLSLIAKTAAFVVLKLVSSPFTTSNVVATSDQATSSELRIFTELPEDGSKVTNAEVDSSRPGQPPSMGRDDLAA